MGLLRLAEFTTMAGRRLRDAVKQTLISNGEGEFDDETRVVIAGLTNTYSQYIATVEEYTQQRYEVIKTCIILQSPLKTRSFKLLVVKNHNKFCRLLQHSMDHIHYLHTFKNLVN